MPSTSYCPTRVCSVEFDPLRLASSAGTQGKHLPDTFEGLFGLAFLEEAYDGVDHRHSQNHPGVDPMPEERLRHAGAEENVNQNIVKVLEEPLQQPFFRRLRKSVWAYGFKPVGGLGGGETVAPTLQCVQYFIGRQGMRVADTWGSARSDLHRSVRSLSHDLSLFSGMRLTCGVSNDAFVVKSGLEVKFVAAAKARSTLATRIAKREISCALMDLIFGAFVQSSAAVMAIAMAIASQGLMPLEFGIRQGRVERRHRRNMVPLPPNHAHGHIYRARILNAPKMPKMPSTIKIYGEDERCEIQSE